MHLAIDIGNSILKFALFDRDTLFAKGAGIDELATMLQQSAQQVSRTIISSVAVHDHVAELLKKHNISYAILTPATPIPIINSYQSPATLGADRLTLAIAGYFLLGPGPVLVIGAGTCITYNFSEQGSFHGGAISPGITMRFQALQHYTSRLPLVDWSAYRHSIYDQLVGRDSQQSIESGVLNGVLQEVSGTIEEYRHRYSGLRVAVTGGDMDFLVKNLKNDIFARPDMVLEGLNYILLHDA